MRVLINRSDAIGDSILTSPMAKLIKEKYPEAKVTFLISARTADVFKNHPYIDNFRIYHRNARFYYKIKEIFKYFKEEKPTHYFYVGGGYLPNFMAWFFGIPFRGGLKSRWHTYLFLNKGIRQKRSMVTMHEMEYNLNLLSPLEIKYHYKDQESLVPEIVLSNDEIQSSMRIFNKELESNNIETLHKMIFIHPGMTGHTLNWSSRNYGRLILKFEENFPNKYLFIISHTPSDHHFLIGLKDILAHIDDEKLKQRIYFYNGQKNGLRQYMGVLSNASLFIGPSTGTLHIAAALGIPSIGIYSPIKIQSALRWGPRSKNKEKLKIVIPDVICGETIKCAEKDCPYYECMSKIEVEDVYKNAIQVLDF